MSWQPTIHPQGSTPTDLFGGGFSWGLVLIGGIALLALTAVCTFGILARVRDRAADRRSLAALAQAAQPAGQQTTDQPIDSAGRQQPETGGSSPSTG